VKALPWCWHRETWENNEKYIKIAGNPVAVRVMKVWQTFIVFLKAVTRHSPGWAERNHENLS
jgi:hypothetical protein